jgi:hypothetical protein
MFSLLWGIAVVLFAFWVLGLVLHLAGSFIHLLLVLAIAIAVYNLVRGRSVT